jgi:steroid 5-alpha reductase family enzyme
MPLSIDHALLFALIACGAFAGVAWLLSVATQEHSWVDRLWSIAPSLYCWWFAYESQWDARVVLMAVLATIWGARLTFNFARKGGYARGGEDYRWLVLKGRMSPALFQVFNLVFVACVQNAILLAITLPAWVAMRNRTTPLNAIDLVATATFVVLLVGETIADEQQWRFQKEKAGRKARGERIENEFLTTGLFRYSRHPNFFCEQAMWFAFYVFSVAAGAGWLNPVIGGAVVLTALFQGSTNFTESNTL